MNGGLHVSRKTRGDNLNKKKRDQRSRSHFTTGHSTYKLRADGGGHGAALGLRGVGVLGVGRDLELDVIVLVELGQRPPLRLLQRVQQLLDLAAHLPPGH